MGSGADTGVALVLFNVFATDTRDMREEDGPSATSGATRSDICSLPPVGHPVSKIKL